MKNMILAALAVLSLSAAVAPAAFARSTVADSAQVTRMEQTVSFSQ